MKDFFIKLKGVITRFCFDGVTVEMNHKLWYDECLKCAILYICQLWLVVASPVTYLCTAVDISAVI